MLTKLIDGKQTRADDQEILAAIAQKPDRSPWGPGVPRLVGIRNEAGEIYRAVQTEGPREFASVCDSLVALGFTDELAGASGTRHRCDAIFFKH